MQKQVQQVAGYIRIPVQWFDDEPVSYETRAFTVYRDHDDVVGHPELRAFWRSRIVPVYANYEHLPLEDQPLVSLYDTKSNPRRVHPFAHAYVSWANRVMRYVHSGGQGVPPVCILKRCVVPRSTFSRFRESLPEALIPLLEYEYHDALPALVRLQSWCRTILAERVARDKRLVPEYLFQCDKDSLEFAIRFQKAGIDMETYRTMSSSSTIMPVV